MKKTFLYFIVVFLCINATIYAQENTKKQKIQTISEKFLAENKIPGMAISISINNKLFFSEGFGYSNLKSKEKVKPNLTKFRIASISKTLTAVALAKLVDDKKLDFDASLYTYLPNYPKKKYDFTLRQIGGHIAGIRHYRGNEFLSNKKMTIVNGLDLFKNDPLLFKPGTNYKYSTYGWNLLSVVIQNASNKNYLSYMENEIFSPLEMNNTGWFLSEIDLANHSKQYDKKRNKLKTIPLYGQSTYPDGGLRSSVAEVSKFFIALLNEGEYQGVRILKKASVAEMLRFQFTEGNKPDNVNMKEPDKNSGIFWATKRDVTMIGHSGTDSGVKTEMLSNLSKDVAVILFSNTAYSNQVLKGHFAIYDELWRYGRLLRSHH